MRKGDRENGELGRGDQAMERDKRWNRLERRREGELLGTEARGGTAWNGGDEGEILLY